MMCLISEYPRPFIWSCFQFWRCQQRDPCTPQVWLHLSLTLSLCWLLTLKTIAIEVGRRKCSCLGPPHPPVSQTDDWTRQVLVLPLSYCFCCVLCGMPLPLQQWIEDSGSGLGSNYVSPVPPHTLLSSAFLRNLILMFDTVLYSAFCYVRSENWYTCPPPQVEGFWETVQPLGGYASGGRG